MSMILSFFNCRSNVYDPFSLEAWDPFEGWPLNISFRKLFGNLRSNFPSSSNSETVSFSHATIDWEKTSNAHVFKADVPGLQKEEVKVEFEDNQILLISGEMNR
ncbi:17.8 kDa class I heat shock protein [Forsythia ovata]|uniref:17.8 kDa class I heat shock protein n=1 Tax=Forsythia ovata TaxID=205694 RepID=A0ABD1X7Y9_9LAMI